MNSIYNFIRTTLPNQLSSLFISVFVYLSVINSLQATHIVGGQLTYRSLGKNYFEVTIVFRRDCQFGAKDAPLDNPALLGVFYERDRQKAFKIGYDGVVPMKLLSNDTLDESIDQVCLDNFEKVCVHQAIYRDTVYLPYDDSHPGGYILAYQRCCRNKTLTNIEDPLNTGSTYTVLISEATIINNGNSSPVFRDSFPPLYICAGKQFNFHHFATDSDGDSLVYSFCTPFLGKTDSFPAGRPEQPPYKPVIWKSPFSLNNLIGGPISIDPRTGRITASPNILGQFLIGVCVAEYREGVLIGYSTRDFELNVVPCGTKPNSAFERTSPLCDGLNVTFKNNSINGIDFTWYFDWLNNQNLTSTNFSPSFTYSKAGQYEVVLVSKNGSCDDTARLTITVIDPQLKPDFTYTVDCLNNGSIQITNTSTASGQITNYLWKLFGPKDSTHLNQKDPLFTLHGDGRITVQLTITDANGCTSSITKDIDIKLIVVDLLGDASICRGDSAKLVRNPDPTLQYKWEPANTLNLNNPSDPIARPNITTTYTVTITSGFCTEVKQITVTVKDRIDVSITGDTAVCDKTVDLFAKSDSTNQFIWSLSPTFDPVLFTGEHLTTTINGTKTFYVKAGTAAQCQDSASITVSDRSVNLSFKGEHEICTGDTFQILLTNSNPNDNITIYWFPNPIIIGPLNVLSPTVFISSPGRYVLYFNAKNQYTCEQNDSIVIRAVEPPSADFTLENECGSLKIKVTAFSDKSVTWDFGDGIGTSHEKMVTYTYTKKGKYIVTLTVDDVCIRSLEKEIILVDLQSTLADTIISCFGEPVHLNPGANPNHQYEWTPATGLDDPNSPNPLATVSTTTTYFVTIKDKDFPEACSIKDSVTVFVPPALSLTLSNDTTLCEKAKIILRVTSNLSGTEFEWYDENNKPVGKGTEIEVTPEKSTFYYVIGTDTYGCSLNDTVFVELFELTATISGPDFICFSDSVFLRVSAPSGSNYTYEWSPTEFIIGSTTDSVILVKPNVTTTFTVKIKNDHNCQWELTKTVTVNNPQSSLSVSADPDATIVIGDSTRLIATFNQGWKYLWRPNDGTLSDTTIHNPVAKPTVTTTYTVTIIDESGCEASATITVTVRTCEESVFLPNAFSPNEDGKNDTLYVRHTQNSITKMELVIYNRWGEKVFSTTNKDTGWDGKYGGENLPPDVYGYGLKFTCHEDREFGKKGNISIIK